MEYDTVFLVDDFITEEKLAKSKDKADALNTTKLNEEINLLYVAVTRTRYQLYIPETLLPAGFAGASSIHVERPKKETRAGASIYRSAAPRSSAPQSSSQSFLAARRAAKNRDTTSAVPGKTVAEKTALEKTALEKTALGKTAFGKIVSGKIVSGNAVPGKAALGKEITGKAALGNAVTGKAVSERDAYQPWTPDLDKALRKMAETRAPIAKIAGHFGRTKGAIYARLKKLGYFPE